MQILSDITEEFRTMNSEILRLPLESREHEFLEKLKIPTANIVELMRIFQSKPDETLMKMQTWGAKPFEAGIFSSLMTNFILDPRFFGSLDDAFTAKFVISFNLNVEKFDVLEALSFDDLSASLSLPKLVTVQENAAAKDYPIALLNDFQNLLPLVDKTQFLQNPLFRGLKDAVTRIVTTAAQTMVRADFVNTDEQACISAITRLQNAFKPASGGALVPGAQ